MSDSVQPCAYEVDGRPVAADEFTRVACDPHQSVVVEACAGSGKTWLLVARMLRLLLAGAAPPEMLAITFTRKAAQEMRERLMQLLEELAFGDAAQVRLLLAQRGVAERDLPSAVTAARGLYDRVLSSPQHLSIDTFHSWFGRIIQLAPLSCGVPHGCRLTETTGELLSDAYGRFMQSLKTDSAADVRDAMLELYRLAGDHQARQLLDAFVDKRAEWWAATRDDADAPLQMLTSLCGNDALRDARLALWEDDALCRRIQEIARLLGCGSKTNQGRAGNIESALSASPCVEAFERLIDEFCNDKGSPRGNKHTSGPLKAAIAQCFGERGAGIFEEECSRIVDALLQLRRRACENEVVALNRALFVAGNAYLEQYRLVKEQRQVFDFSDLEWHAYRLLTDDAHAAFLHSRLDTRYKHILLDEFQDTNPLQWSIVRAWLDAYGSDGDQPSVFIVGDPKQSIYRFRRAEPRVFSAARQALARQGARMLQTNQTRRNASCIVDLLNRCLAYNPIFRSQTTLAAMAGTIGRLPLVQAVGAEEMDDTEDEGGAGSVKGAAGKTKDLRFRNPLTTAREEQEDARRRDEGRLVARALIQIRRGQPGDGGAALKWSDIMLLVKKRTHLSAYETALREAGVPFVSSRRGGLLDSLEAADLTALLTFLSAPGDARALAHVLKSPMFMAADDDLVLLAEQSENGWWNGLRTIADNVHAPAALRRAHGLLEQWLEKAPRLPVHDLLDLVMHQGRLLPRYAEAALPGLRLQVIGNIEAFIELALNLDAGRYPSLPKFLDALRQLKRHADSDAPDEAAVDAAMDAVRIMTIHSAKGLEAEVVVLLDANHSDPKQDEVGILCDWPQDGVGPSHFSAFGKRAVRGAARDKFFQLEDGFRIQEDWNLLYVAATRAKRTLLVSGVADKKAGADGVADNSWYARLLSMPEWPCEPPAAIDAAAAVAEFTLALFDPPELSVPAPAAPHRTEAMDEGVLLHALMERLTKLPQWPVILPEAAEVAHWLQCPDSVATAIRQHAAAMLCRPELQRFFDRRQHRAAFNEMDVVSEQRWLRLDRVVLFDDEAWILDYKRNVLDSERMAYHRQLAEYRCAARAIYPEFTWRTALITADGALHEVR